MKQYYEVLGIPMYENDQNVILNAYRAATFNVQQSFQRYREFQYYEQSFILINEAYLVLSDIELKKKYDRLLEMQVLSIEEEISTKRSQAESFIKSQINTLYINYQEENSPSDWLGPAIFFIIIFVLVLVLIVHAAD